MKQFILTALFFCAIMLAQGQSAVIEKETVIHTKTAEVLLMPEAKPVSQEWIQSIKDGTNPLCKKTQIEPYSYNTVVFEVPKANYQRRVTPNNSSGSMYASVNISNTGNTSFVNLTSFGGGGVTQSSYTVLNAGNTFTISRTR